MSFACGDVPLARDIACDPLVVGNEVHVYRGPPQVLRMSFSGWALWSQPRPDPTFTFKVAGMLPDWAGKPLVVCTSVELHADLARAESAVAFFRHAGFVRIMKYDHATGGFDLREMGEATITPEYRVGRRSLLARMPGK